MWSCSDLCAESTDRGTGLGEKQSAKVFAHKAVYFRTNADGIVNLPLPLITRIRTPAFSRIVPVRMAPPRGVTPLSGGLEDGAGGDHYLANTSDYSTNTWPYIAEQPASGCHRFANVAISPSPSNR